MQFTFVALTTLLAGANAGLLFDRAASEWEVVAFKADTAQRGYATVSFNVSIDDNGGFDSCTHSAPASDVNKLVAINDAACESGSGLTFSFLPRLDSADGAFLNVTWHFTSHGQISATYSIPAKDLEYQGTIGGEKYIGPTSFLLSEQEQ